MKKAKNLIVTLMNGEIARFDKAHIEMSDALLEVVSTGGKHYIFPWCNVAKFVFEEDNGSEYGTKGNRWGF